MNYLKDIKIDESALDVEWLNQPALMMKYSIHAANSREAYDRAKDALDFVKAELDMKIRTSPKIYGINDRVTEGAIFSVIQRAQQYIDAMEDLNAAKYEYEVAKGAVVAFEQRKSALENLVRLYGSQYFAGPSVPRDLSKETLLKQQEKKSEKGTASKINRRN